VQVQSGYDTRLGLTVGPAAANFDGAFAAFDINGVNQQPTSTIFGANGYSVQASPVAQVLGNVQANLNFVDPLTANQVLGGLNSDTTDISPFSFLSTTGMARDGRWGLGRLAAHVCVAAGSIGLKSRMARPTPPRTAAGRERWPCVPYQGVFQHTAE
jgi:hypothetical protein